MAMSDSERRLLDDLAADSSVEFSEADRDALVRGGVPIFCLLRCAGQFVLCGPTSGDCQRRFIECVLACLGVGGGENNGGNGGD